LSGCYRNADPAPVVVFRDAPDGLPIRDRCANRSGSERLYDKNDPNDALVHNLVALVLATGSDECNYKGSRKGSEAHAFRWCGGP
jgi:hypothetical protein